MRTLLIITLSTHYDGRRGGLVARRLQAIISTGRERYRQGRSTGSRRVDEGGGNEALEEPIGRGRGCTQEMPSSNGLREVEQNKEERGGYEWGEGKEKGKRREKNRETCRAVSPVVGYYYYYFIIIV